MEAKRSGGLVGGVAFTIGMPLNPEPVLLGFFLSTEASLCRAAAIGVLVRKGGNVGLKDEFSGGAVLMPSSGETGFPIEVAELSGGLKVFLSAVDFDGSLNAEGGSLEVVSFGKVSLPEIGLSVSETSWLGSSFESDETYFID